MKKFDASKSRLTTGNSRKVSYQRSAHNHVAPTAGAGPEARACYPLWAPEARVQSRVPGWDRSRPPAQPHQQCGSSDRVCSSLGLPEANKREA